MIPAVPSSGAGAAAGLLAAAMAARRPPPRDLSANQIMLFIRAAMERLEWEIPRHDGPLKLSPDSRRLLAAHCGDIAAGLAALLAIPTTEPEPLDAFEALGGADV